MGKIGPRQQRYEVLAAAQWDVEDLVHAWRADALAERGASHEVVADAGRDLQAAEPDR